MYFENSILNCLLNTSLLLNLFDMKILRLCKQISISTCLHMNHKFVAHVKEKYRDELELELNNMIDMRKDNNNVALM